VSKQPPKFEVVLDGLWLAGPGKPCNIVPAAPWAPTAMQVWADELRQLAVELPRDVVKGPDGKGVLRVSWTDSGEAVVTFQASPEEPAQEVESYGWDGPHFVVEFKDGQIWTFRNAYCTDQQVEGQEESGDVVVTSDFNFSTLPPRGDL
jgi:hypothetical protein